MGKRLANLIELGYAFIEDDQVVGIAIDGVELALGNIYNFEAIENYLADYPSPYDW